jgi:hypothetical protein
MHKAVPRLEAALLCLSKGMTAALLMISAQVFETPRQAACVTNDERFVGIVLCLTVDG